MAQLRTPGMKAESLFLSKKNSSMKSLFVFLGLITAICGYSQQGEIFTIVKVKGNIVNITAKNPLAAGSVVGSRDQLEFGSVDAEAIAISNTRGKFIIKPPLDDVLGTSIAMASANNSAFPIASRSQYSVRALNFKVDDFASYLGDSAFFIIGDSVRIGFLSSIYPLDENRYFSASYPNGGADINVDIVGNKQEIVLSRKELFAAHPTATAFNAVTFYYLDATKQTINRISTVKVSFLEKKTLESELRSVVRALSNQEIDQASLRNYLKEYLLDIYGNTDPTALQSFLNAFVNN